MFSRTTMASSINKPTQSDNAIKVTILMVKPNIYMNKNVPMMAMGKVNPVMTVERHEFRNKNTIKTVSKAPSIRVRRTFSTPTRIGREPSCIVSKTTPLGNSALMAVTALLRLSTTSIVFSSNAFCTVMSKVRCPL